MAKEKSPAFQFYPKDVLSDGNAMAMPAEAFGIYMRLLCFDWIDDGLIDCQKTWMRLGGFDPFDFQGEERRAEDWDIIISHIKPQFVPHPTKEGFVTNPRLLKEREKQSERSAEASKSAKKRWQANDDATASNPHSDGICEGDAKRCSSSSSSSSSSDLNTNDLAPITFWTDGLLDEITEDQAKAAYASAGLEPPDFEHGKARTNRHLDAHPEQRTRKGAYSALITFGLSEAMKFAADRQRLVKNKGSPTKPTQQAVLDKNKAKLIQARKEAEDEKRRRDKGGNSGVIDADILRVG